MMFTRKIIQKTGAALESNGAAKSCAGLMTFAVLYAGSRSPGKSTKDNSVAHEDEHNKERAPTKPLNFPKIN